MQRDDHLSEFIHHFPSFLFFLLLLLFAFSFLFFSFFFLALLMTLQLEKIQSLLIIGFRCS